MDEETRAGFDEMRRGFAEMNARFAAVDARFDAVDARFDAVDRGMVGTNQRVDTLEERVMREIRHLGVITEDLRTQIQVVAEGVIVNGRAIERLSVEMNERFRENEIIVGGAFRQIRSDLDELREQRQ
jgi:hypothetical protein